MGTTVVASFLLLFGVTGAAHLFVYPNTPFKDLLQNTQLVLLEQLLTYFVVFAVMYRTIEVHTGRFWKPVRWNWPGSWWIAFLLGGSVLYFVLAMVGALLPIPKHLPIDRFFDNAQQAWLMSVFAVTIAPLMEELFFRGFLYPVLERRWGIEASVFLTSAAFAALHGAQLKYSWAVLIIFLVGVALTLVRAVTKSVAASCLVHMGYNGTLSLLLFVMTGGFRHMEKLNQ